MGLLVLKAGLRQKITKRGKRETRKGRGGGVFTFKAQVRRI